MRLLLSEAERPFLKQPTPVPKNPNANLPGSRLHEPLRHLPVPERRPTFLDPELSKNHHDVGQPDESNTGSMGKSHKMARRIHRYHVAIDIRANPIEIKHPPTDIYEKPSGIDP